MQVTKQRRDAFRFFLENAGYATPPGRAACALELARAEELLEAAMDAEVAEFVWDYDDFPYEHDGYTAEQIAAKFDSNEWTGPFSCRLKIGDMTVAGLGGIVVGPRGTDDPYCRVVAAELADEVRDELQAALNPPRHQGGVESYRRVELDDGTLVQIGVCVDCGNVIARRYVTTGAGTGPWVVLPTA